MAFDPSKYKVSTGERFMPVVLLLDVSGSMSGDKIDNLYAAIVKMIETFAEEGKKEIPYKVAIITFGASVDYHTPYADATKDLASNLSRFYANGMTPLGTALRMAKDLIEDKTETKSKWYRPAVVLVSDGYPNDSWQSPLQDFISNGRTARCQRLSMGIGNDADYNMLENFASDDIEKISGTNKLCFKAENAADIVKVFKLISVSITASAGSNKKDFPTAKSSSISAPRPTPTEDDEFI